MEKSSPYDAHCTILLQVNLPCPEAVSSGNGSCVSGHLVPPTVSSAEIVISVERVTVTPEQVLLKNNI